MSAIIGDRKFVVAHFMVGNTYPYTVEDWLEDILLAQKHNLDGFALNVGKEFWQHERIADCFAAATISDCDFKLFLSFDMSTFPCATVEDIDVVCALFERVAAHPSYLKVNGKALVSTFSGECSLFGHGSFVEAWSTVKRRLEITAEVCFVPAYFIDPGRYAELDFIDGAFHWNGCWPVHLTAGSPQAEKELPILSSDAPHITNLKDKLYMASVSPWFYTHYGEESWNKNWIYRSDDWLLVRRWEHILAIREQVNIVQVISWNDYGESHYIGPIKGAQPNSQAWVDGFDHTPWLSLNCYFARAFKEGGYAWVDEFKIYVWSRPHTRDALATVDIVGRPRGWELTDDCFWTIVLAPSPARVELRSHPSEVAPTIRHIAPGYSKLKHNLVDGGGMLVKVICAESGKVVIDFCVEGFCFTDQPRTYNFNAFVATYPGE